MIDAETFDRLLAPVACGISIYLPVDTEQRDKRAPQARLRTLVDGAQALLERCEIEPHEQASLTDSLSGAVDSIDFARHRDPGLAIFAGHLTDGNSLLEVVSLPQSPAELATVGTDFHIKPLLPLIAANQRFGILALSKANVRLLTATPFTWTELKLETLPIEAQAELDSRPAVESAPGEDAAQDARRELLVSSANYIETAVKAAIGNDPAPLVLVADSHVAGHFRQQVEISQIHEQWLDLNPFALSDTELHAKALDVIRPELDVDLNAVLEQVVARLGTAEPDVAIKLEEILTAASEGRVDAIVVAEDEAIWGCLNPDGSVLAHGTPVPPDEDLLNLAAILTLRHGGRAFAVPCERIPRRVPAAATLRF
jgi:hypothetical protein